jgi:hypothetical protein
MECTILEILRGDRSYGPHIWLKLRIEPRGPEVFVPLFGESPATYRTQQRVDVDISVRAHGSPDMAPRPPIARRAPAEP